MAHQLEDYTYLDVMVNHKAQLSNGYAIFVKAGELPLTLQRDTNLTLFQLAIIYNMSYIDILLFRELIHTICDNQSVNADEQIAHFEQCVHHVQNPPSVPIEEGDDE
jgi:hypothetical protein